MDFPWYKTCSNGDNSLEQGDFIWQCPILIPPFQINEGDTPDIEVQKIDSIILSQSCDLVNHKIEIVLVCPFYPLTHWIQSVALEKNSKERKKIVDNLRKGYFPAYHILNKQEGGGILEDYQVVDFRNVYGINFQLLQNIIEHTGTRIRLLPPYREHLSQAFARYFMRVGLPQDIVIDSNY